MVTRGIDVVYFKLFDNCNAKCNMCDCWERPRSRKNIGHYEAVLASVLAAGPRSIRFTGGEPLLFRELPRLVRRAAEAGVRVSVISNGRLLPRKVRQLAEHGCDEIVLSLDGVGEIHDTIRNTPRLFGQILASISGINLTPMSYGVNTVVQRQGVRELPRLAEILLAQARPPCFPVSSGRWPAATWMSWLMPPCLTGAPGRRARCRSSPCTSTPSPAMPTAVTCWPILTRLSGTSWSPRWKKCGPGTLPAGSGRIALPLPTGPVRAATSRPG
jgi:uncharacterized Fe-S cluster-containing radical SAM superfamily protein